MSVPPAVIVYLAFLQNDVRNIPKTLISIDNLLVAVQDFLMFLLCCFINEAVEWDHYSFAKLIYAISIMLLNNFSKFSFSDEDIGVQAPKVVNVSVLQT